MSSLSPKISVLTVCRNRMKTLPRAVESVLSQGSFIHEYIIQDGASTDGSLEYLRSLNDPRIKIQSESDTGISDALNRAVGRVTGDWILFVHSDDQLAPGALQAVHSRLSGSKPNEMQCFGIEIVNSDGSFEYYNTPHPKQILARMSIPHPGLVAHADAYKSVGGFDTALKIAMDYDWTLRALNKEFILRPNPEIIQRMQLGGVSDLQISRANRESFRVQMRHSPERKWKICLRFLKNSLRIAIVKVSKCIEAK